MDLIAIPFGYIMRFCAWICSNNYALALLIFTLIVKIVLLPFGIKQQSSQIKAAKLRPKIAAIEKKYAGRTDRPTMQKKQQEIMELQQREGVSMFGGCLPLLIQLPILFGLYGVIRNPLTHLLGLSQDAIVQIKTALDSTFTGGFGAIDQISLIKDIRANSAAVQGLVNVADLPNFTLFSIDLTPSPSEVFPSLLFIIPIFAAVSSYFTMVLSRRLSGAAQMMGNENARKSNIIMDLLMPLISGYFSYIYPATLGLYWAYNSIFGIVQSLVLAKVMPLPRFTPEEMKKAEKELKLEEAKRKPTKIRSLHHIDDDDDEDMAASAATGVSSRYGDDEESAPAEETAAPAVAPAPLKDDSKRPTPKKKAKKKTTTDSSDKTE